MAPTIHNHFTLLFNDKKVFSLIGTLAGFLSIPDVKDHYNRYAWSLLSPTLEDCLIAPELQPFTVCGAVNSERKTLWKA